MALHPQVVTLIEKMAAADLKPVVEMTPVDARAQFDSVAGPPLEERTPVGSIEDIRVPGPAGALTVRLYRPQAEAAGPLPLLVYFHGGGHVIGSLESHDEVARVLCVGADCVVASVDYRLAPEHKFPAAIEDAFAATQWLTDNAGEHGADPASVAVAGDSAGANIAAVVALMARDAGGPALITQILVYPLADYACNSPSYQTYASGFGPLTEAGMLWFQDHYLRGPDDMADWRASPVKAPDLSGLPPALVITAECDVLHDEGVAFAEALAAAGTPVEHVDWPGMIHGFFSFAPYLDDGKAAQRLACERLREAFAGAGT
ncbi:MAG: alpha/beta hydrolase fold domain-containing protein [Alphaproteobacteria bacterium]|nr:alpha/beta hydrolase fold domain-containing protein [Alphaproteobacteria bacterium]